VDASHALLAGLAAGLAIAMQFGAVSMLLVEASMVAGPRAGLAAGMGVATADLAFAVVAAVAGGAAGAALSSHESEIRLAAAAVLVAVAVHGLIGLRREGDGGPREGGMRGGHYGRFLAITAANPLTIASFAAVAAALSFDGAPAAAAFAAGVGLASAAWHLVLSAAAGHAARWATPRARRALAVGGRLAVVAFAVQLALGAT
jgi:threonine/homoserine/homoserine lactone efflux protein